VCIIMGIGQMPCAAEAENASDVLSTLWPFLTRVAVMSSTPSQRARTPAARTVGRCSRKASVS
jgi:hypothetical protein